MSEIIEIKNLLRELAKKENNQALIEAWIEIWNQGYIDNFPKICIDKPCEILEDNKACFSGAPVSVPLNNIP